MSDTKKAGTKSPPLMGMLAKAALVAVGGGGILAVDQFGIIDSLLGTEGSDPAAQVVSAVVEDNPMMSSAMSMMRGGAYDGLSWAMHGAVDAVLYPLKVAKEGF
jgi:hypothetical protein